MSSPSRSTPAKPRRWLWPAIVLVAILALASWFLSSRDGGDAQAYRTAAVERGEIRTAISATGTLSATATVDVGTQVSGILQAVNVEFNDAVKKDQVIAPIYPSTFQAHPDQAYPPRAHAPPTPPYVPAGFRRRRGCGSRPRTSTAPASTSTRP